MIASTDEDLQKDLHNLTRTLLIRQYPLHFINNNISRALIHSQDELIFKTRTKDNKCLLPFITTYSPAGIHLARTIQHTWPKDNRTITNIWNRPPITAFKRTKSLKDILVHTNQKPLNNTAP